jgi:Ca2+-binding EF-hand superfamily protein
MKITTLLAAAAIICLAPAASYAQQKETVVRHNDDGSTTTRTTYYYQDHDLNNNGILDSQEFNSYVYNRWDRNGDGFVSPDEWEGNYIRWYKTPINAEFKTYTYWDKDGNGRLDPQEFDTVMTTTKLYKTWDTNADDIIESNEYANSTFAFYDQNNDGMISAEEWKASH